MPDSKYQHSTTATVATSVTCTHLTITGGDDLITRSFIIQGDVTVYTEDGGTEVYEHKPFRYETPYNPFNPACGHLLADDDEVDYTTARPGCTVIPFEFKRTEKGGWIGERPRPRSTLPSARRTNG